MSRVLLLPFSLFLLPFSGCAVFSDEDEGPTIYTYDEVTVKPAPVGGFDAITANLRYPEIANRASVVGTVLVHLIVPETGELPDDVGFPDLSITKAIGAGCDEEALRAIRSVSYTPGVIDGRTVAVRMCIAVEYNLDLTVTDFDDPARKRFKTRLCDAQPERL